MHEFAWRAGSRPAGLQTSVAERAMNAAPIPVGIIYNEVVMLPRSFRSYVSFLSVFVFALCALSGCNRPAQQAAKPNSVENTSATPAIQAQSLLPDCDLPPTALGASKATGHHRVILTWNPSSSSRGANDQSVGYCLYKSRNGDITATNLHDCRNCSRVNRRPILGSGCVDNYVEDGSTYQYVAGAVKAGTGVKLFSNRTTAVIPPNTRTVRSDSPYPLCQSDALMQGQVPAKPDP